MKNFLFIVSSLCLAITGNSQTNRSSRLDPSGISNRSVRSRFVSENENNKTAAKVAPIKKISVNTTGLKTAAVSATSCTHFSGSTNAFGFYQGGHEALQYNPDLNAISFVHRASPTYTSIPNGNSGTIVTKWSVNNGTSWDSTVIWTSTSNLGRYPQGGLYNPLGNTNINNAYAVGTGVAIVSGFDGSWLCSKKLTTPGNVTPSTDMQFVSNVAPFAPPIKKIDFPRYGFTYTKDGLVRGLGEVCNDINNTTTNVGYGIRGEAILKGTFVAGAFVWSYDSLIPATILRSDGSKQLTSNQARMAWNDAGTVGYVVMLGVRAGSIGAMKGYQPIVYKTTNSGASWSLLPANCFNNLGLIKRLWPVNTNSTLIVPFFSPDEGIDAAVDVNNNLHIVTTVVGSSSTHNDSLDYTNTFGSQNYRYPYGGSFGFPTIYDFFTTTSGGWNCNIIDSMGTEGLSDVNPLNPWSVGAMPLDARIQICHSPDRKKLFYSWTETDTSVTGFLHWNAYPDIKMRGYDVTIDKMTQRLNVTAGLINPSMADQTAYFHFMANRSISTTSVTNEIPFTISYNSSNDGNLPMNHYYLKGAVLNQSDFTLNPFTVGGGCFSTEVNSINPQSQFYDAFCYPNPANGSTTISVNLKNNSDLEISISNAIGQLVYNTKTNSIIGNNDVHIDLSKFNSGVYFYTVRSGNSSITKKLIVD